MPDVRPEVAAFFAAYDDAGHRPDASAADFFGETFMSLDPSRAMALRREVLATVLPQRRSAFEQVGVAGLTLASLTEEPLSEHYTLARTTWAVRWVDSGPPIEVAADFVLRHAPAGWEIVVYLNHHDVMAELADRA